MGGLRLPIQLNFHKPTSNSSVFHLCGRAIHEGLPLAE